MTSHPTLSTIPPELISQILLPLSLPDLCSLRLTNHDLHALTQDLLKPHFRSKSLRLSDSAQLQRFVSVTSQRGSLGYLLEDLTLVGLPSSPTPKDAPLLLGQALTNLRLGLPSGRLNSLSLIIEDGVQYRGFQWVRASTPWASVWSTAGALFTTTMHALSASALPITSLILFTSVTCCSLSLDYFSLITSLPLSPSLSNLKHLSLSLSHHMEIDEDDDDAIPPAHSTSSPSTQAPSTGELHTSALCAFLQHCAPLLSSLEIHWYQLRSFNLTPAQREEQHFLARVSRCCLFPHLQRLTLRGLRTTESALLALLQQQQPLRQQLTALTLDEVHLAAGRFRPITDYLVSNSNSKSNSKSNMEDEGPKGQLSHIHLDNLFAKHRLVYFDAPGTPHFMSLGPLGRGPNAITRRGADARRLPVRYAASGGAAMGSIEFERWRHRRQIEYGPPGPIIGKGCGYI